MKETIELYTKKSKTYLHDADVLMKNEGFESAVSRAYYAMFYMAKALLFTVGNNAHTHQGVISQFSKQFILTGVFKKKHGSILAKTLQKRQNGNFVWETRLIEPIWAVEWSVANHCRTTQ